MRRIIVEHEAKAGWSHFIGNRAFSLHLCGEKQDYCFTLTYEEVSKLKMALAEYDNHNSKQD